MKKNSSVQLVIIVFVFSLLLFAHIVNKDTPDKSLQKTETVNRNVSIPLDQGMFDDRTTEFSVKQTVNLKLKDTKLEEAISNGSWEKMMSYDNEGYQVLGGLREDPFRYQYEGTCNGIVTRDDTGEIIARYEFRVLKLLAGATERFEDAFLVCKGSYWLPVPIQKLDIEWQRIPPTRAWYEAPASGFGVMLNAERSIPGKFLRFKSNRPVDSQFILSAALEPLFFGKGFVHVPAH
ncbi:MAG: hypothetical protein R6X10_18490 [Desulfobacterales bacterium]